MNTQVERSKFLMDLLAEVDAFDEGTFSSPFPLEPGDREVGIASPWAKKAYALMRFIHRELKRMKVEMEFEKSEAVRLAKTYSVLDHKYDLLKEMLWCDVRNMFDLWAEESVGIREGWKVVIAPSDSKEQQFKKFLGGIFGQLE